MSSKPFADASVFCAVVAVMVAIAVAHGSSGCTGASGLRPVAYPLGFERIDHAEVRAEMRAISRAVLQVEAALHDSPSVDRLRLIAALREMESAVGNVRSGGLHSDHPVLDEALPRFQQDVRAAREAAERDPPNDYLAAAVVGACRYCHR